MALIPASLILIKFSEQKLALWLGAATLLGFGILWPKTGRHRQIKATQYPRLISRQDANLPGALSGPPFHG